MSSDSSTPVLKSPDVTPVQLVAIVPVLAALLRAFGVYDLSPEQQNALNDAVTFAIGLVGADAVIRFGRALSRRS